MTVPQSKTGSASTVTVAVASSSKPTTPATTVLELDLRGGVSDQPSSNPFAAFGSSGLALTDVVDGLHQAQSDSSVKALLIRLPESGMTPATADELRQAININEIFTELHEGKIDGRVVLTY